MNEIDISIENVSKEFEHANGDTITALRDLTFDVRRGEVLSIVGPSGCGKSTVLNLINGFLQPDAGNIFINRDDAKFGMVAQRDSVFDWLNVNDNVRYGLESREEKLLRPMVKKIGLRQASEYFANRSKAAAQEYLKLLNLSEYAESWPRELSVGFRKRVELGRALSSQPDIIMLDEAFSALDYFSREEMQLLIGKIWANEKKTIVAVSHDLEEAIFISHRVLVMSGRPGSVKKIFDIDLEMPRHPGMKLSDRFIELRRQILDCLENPNQNNT